MIDRKGRPLSNVDLGGGRREEEEEEEEVEVSYKGAKSLLVFKRRTVC